MPRFITGSPRYTKYRSGITAIDVIANLNSDDGANSSDYLKTHIQVVPSGGADPAVQVLWWCDATGKFIQEHSPIVKGGVGVNTPYEFTIDSHKRIFAVAVTTLTGGSVDIYIAGADISHPE